MRLVEPYIVVIKLAGALILEGVKSVQRGDPVIDRSTKTIDLLLHLILDVCKTVSPRHKRARVLRFFVDSNEKRVIDYTVVSEELSVLLEDFNDSLLILVADEELGLQSEEVYVLERHSAVSDASIFVLDCLPAVRGPF